MSRKRASIVIIGAGPTGLGAAYRLTEHGSDDWLLIEGSGNPGGLASSVTDDQGFVWDLGGHVLFSHYEYFDELMDNLMAEQWLEHIREAWVWIRQRFIPYPFQNNIWRLPQEDLIKALDGLLQVHNKLPVAAQSETFHDWIMRSFGAGLADIFFLPYNYKVWAYEPRKLSACWMQERVATVDLARVIRNQVLQQDDLGWGPNAKFRFPLSGGTGEIWKRLADRLPGENILCGHKVVRVNTGKREVLLDDGTIVAYDYLINTMPLDLFLNMLEGEPALSAQAQEFLHSSTNIVGVGMTGQPPEHLRTKCWMYFAEPEYPFYRVTVFSNYSPNNVPKPGQQWSLMCEVSESSDKPVDQQTLKQAVLSGLQKANMIHSDSEIVSVWQHRLNYGYPTPFVGRDELLGPIDEKLRQQNIWSRGRFGAWKYEVSNQDHSLMQGVEAVDHILCGTEELTVTQPALVNAGKNKLKPLPERRVTARATV